MNPDISSSRPSPNGTDPGSVRRRVVDMAAELMRGTSGATGERASAVLSQDARDGGDIAPDRIIGGDADEPIGANVSDDEDTDDEAGEEDERADF